MSENPNAGESAKLPSILTDGPPEFDPAALDRLKDELLAQPTDLPPPDRVGDYVIIKKINHGGMGIVYEAMQERSGHRVALKLIRPGYMTPERLRRFEYEAKILARLEHPGIARIFYAG